jgi:hypothetical protein
VIANFKDNKFVMVVAKFGSSPKASAISPKVSNKSGAELTRSEIAVLNYNVFTPSVSSTPVYKLVIFYEFNDKLLFGAGILFNFVFID